MNGWKVFCRNLTEEEARKLYEKLTTEQTRGEFMLVNPGDEPEDFTYLNR
jgi:hypothetical protein